MPFCWIHWTWSSSTIIDKKRKILWTFKKKRNWRCMNKKVGLKYKLKCILHIQSTSGFHHAQWLIVSNSATRRSTNWNITTSRGPAAAYCLAAGASPHRTGISTRQFAPMTGCDQVCSCALLNGTRGAPQSTVSRSQGGWKNREWSSERGWKWSWG